MKIQEIDYHTLGVTDALEHKARLPAYATRQQAETYKKGYLEGARQKKARKREVEKERLMSSAKYPFITYGIGVKNKKED